MRLYYSSILFFLLLFGSGSKQAFFQSNADAPTQDHSAASVIKPINPCATFNDAPNPDNTKRNYVLYRDFLKAGDWDGAFDLWKKVYEVAPAADGRRNTVFADGIKFFQHYKARTSDTTEQKAYVDRIFEMYDRIEECFPEGGYIKARKAFDFYYSYPERASRMEIFELFKAAIDADDLKTPDFAINPFAALLVELYFDEQIDLETAKTYQAKVREILEEGLKNCAKNNTCARWETIQGYAPNRLEAFETVRGFYDCAYYGEKYYQEYLDNPDDCDIIRTVFSRLRFGDCPETDERLIAIKAVGQEKCVQATVNATLKSAYECLQNAEYQCAIDSFEVAFQESEDSLKQANYLILIAKIYNAHLKNFPQARAYALKAAELRPDWGEPYILIGRLYASSGPLCGPGRGWDSQIVVWPAIDAWNRAKSIDPEAAAEANKWIRRYAQYMPKKEDVFIRNLKAGQEFRVGCWIQRSTRIRTAD